VSPNGGDDWFSLSQTELFFHVGAAFFIIGESRRMVSVAGWDYGVGAVANDVWSGWAPY